MTQQDLTAQPNAVDAERVLLGSALVSEDAAIHIARQLSTEDFYEPAHQSVFAAITSLLEDRKPVDPVAVWACMQQAGTDRSFRSGIVGLFDLSQQYMPMASLSHHGDLVLEASRRRRIAAAVTTAQAHANNPASGTALEIAADLQKALDAVQEDAISTDTPTMHKAMDDLLAEIEYIQEHGATTGIPTGFPDLDAKLNGLRPGQMIIVAGRPAMGKSTLLSDTLRAAAFQHGKSVLMFSLEMSRPEVMLRIVAAEARIETNKLQTGNVTEEEWERISGFYTRASGARFGIDDSPGVTMADVRAKARTWQTRHGLDLIAIDYLQLLTPSRRAENQQVEISEMSRQAKLLAKEFDVPVIVLSQLNRGNEHRSDHTPMLADLRGSGSLEQDSDVVMFIHREEVYNPDQRVGEADVIIAKQRSGPTGIVPVVAQLHYSRFVPAAFSTMKEPDF